MGTTVRVEVDRQPDVPGDPTETPNEDGQVPPPPRDGLGPAPTAPADDPVEGHVGTPGLADGTDPASPGSLPVTGLELSALLVLGLVLLLLGCTLRAAARRRPKTP